jgi:hypothetical protein
LGDDCIVIGRFSDISENLTVSIFKQNAARFSETMGNQPFTAQGHHPRMETSAQKQHSLAKKLNKSLVL